MLQPGQTAGGRKPGPSPGAPGPAAATLADLKRVLEPLSASAVVDAAKPALRELRQSARTLHDTGAPGQEVCAALAHGMDELVCVLFEKAQHLYRAKYPIVEKPLCLIALGGFGRGELAPYSDIDLCLIHEGRAESYAESVAENILYWMWDLGLEVGHALRSVHDSVQLARADVTIQTATLENRLLAGDPALFDTWRAAMHKHVWSGSPEIFAQQKLAEQTERIKRYGSTVYLLEPNVKLGKGGLRDMQTAIWIGASRSGEPGLAGLLRAGLLSPREHDELARAASFMLRLRNQLHFAAGRKHDRLDFANQTETARAFGYRESRHTLPVERFMRDYYLAARRIAELSQRIIDRCLDAGPAPSRMRNASVDANYHIFKGQLTVRDPGVFARQPETIVELFWKSVELGAPIYSYAREMVSRAAPHLNAPARRHPAARAAMLKLLTQPTGDPDVLEAMHELGALAAMLPEFRRATARHIHDAYHVYTVDVHSLYCLKQLKRLIAGRLAAEEPHLSEAAQCAAAPHVLCLAMLYHDVAKGSTGGHSVRGATMVHEAALRLGMSPTEAADAAFLVREHLTMSTISQRRDLNDHDLIVRFARQVASVDRLRMLYALTYCDISNVGPAMWNDWKRRLLRELFDKTAAVLKGEIARHERAHAAAMRRAELAALLGDCEPVHSFADALHARTLEANSVERLAVFYRLHKRLDQAPLVTELTASETSGHATLYVVGRDRPGLLAMITGALASEGFDVSAAHINTSRNDLVFNVFYIAHAAGAPQPGDPRIRRAVQRLLDAVAGRGVIEPVLQSRRAGARGSQLPSIPFPPRVAWDNDSSRDYTVLDIWAKDRVGLLYHVASKLYDLGISIHLAKITTEADRVVDSFYLQDGSGKRITDPAVLEKIRAALLDGLEA